LLELDRAFKSSAPSPQLLLVDVFD